jgi:hypothetical protein
MMAKEALMCLSSYLLHSIGIKCEVCVVPVRVFAIDV